MECHAEGSKLSDSVELSACMAALRRAEGGDQARGDVWLLRSTLGGVGLRRLQEQHWRGAGSHLHVGLREGSEPRFAFTMKCGRSCSASRTAATAPTSTSSS